MHNPLNDASTHNFILASLAEDIGSGDHSSLASIPRGTKGRAKLLIKDDGILAGVALAEKILLTVDPEIQAEISIPDGAEVKKGDVAMTVTGDVHSILKSERLLLNCAQRLSGIATATRKLVKLVEGTGAKILDTRKTTPGLRMLEKWAVTIGGGYNHRFGLYDMIMLKDNHIDYAGGISSAVTRTRQYLNEKQLKLKIEVETRNLDEVKQALEVGGVDRIMLDNFSPAELKIAVDFIAGRCETEASGGITADNIRAYAETGVQYISVGFITHSVKSLDISLKEF